jgi:hypothetical protein
MAENGQPGAARKRLILSHHQFLTVYDSRLKTVLDAGHEPVLHKEIGETGNSGAITAWIWGHEHRCMAFAHPNIASPRCLGHGGQLQQAHPEGTEPPAPGKWEETAQFEEAGSRWGSFGFAVLDLHEPDSVGPYIEVSYHVDGAQPVVPTERLR